MEIRNNKAIIYHKESNVTIVCSDAFGSVLKFKDPIIGIGTYWGSHGYYSPNELQQEKYEWFVDIYRQDLEKKTYITDLHIANYYFYPRAYSKIEEIIANVNVGVTNLLKNDLKQQYNPKSHSFTISLANNHIQVQVGSSLVVYLTNNLKPMFGFEGSSFLPGTHIGHTLPLTLD